jgi:hypothetical protein
MQGTGVVCSSSCSVAEAKLWWNYPLCSQVEFLLTALSNYRQIEKDLKLTLRSTLSLCWWMELLCSKKVHYFTVSLRRALSVNFILRSTQIKDVFTLK